MANQLTINFPDSEYESIEVRGRVSKLTVESKDKSGDVEVSMEQYGECSTIYLNQEALKALITHLQKQII